MIDLALLIGILAALGTGCLIWKFAFNPFANRQPEAPTRRREDARDWQRRFGTDSLLAANFLQPTQNEILETLCVLDHLTPGWEGQETAVTERAFLNELALNFPTLCKAKCDFPLPFADTLAATGKPGSSATESEIASRREEFRQGRAQFNALEQIVSGAVAPPTEITPGSLPFRAPVAEPRRRTRRGWVPRLAGAAILLIAVVAAAHSFPNAFRHMATQRPFAHMFTEPAPVPTPLSAQPTPTFPVTEPPVAAPATPPPAPVVAAATPGGAPKPPAHPSLTREKAAFEQQIAASKQRAVSKYPTLAVEGSEINVRFVYRYKHLVSENSARLLDPSWPEQLVEECAAASGMAPKRDAFTRVLGTPR